MSEFKTFGLDEAKVLYSAKVNVDRLNEETDDWYRLACYPSMPDKVHRLTPEQELTFEQACLLVGLGLDYELEFFAPPHTDFIQHHAAGDQDEVLQRGWLYRTRPLPKQTKIIPHTMETAPRIQDVKCKESHQAGEAFILRDGRVLVAWCLGKHTVFSLEDAFVMLQTASTGKSYGQEVEA